MVGRAIRLDRAGALNTRDLIWAAIRDLDAAPKDAGSAAGLALFSIAEVAYLSGVDADLVYDYFLGLSKAQPPYLELVQRNRPAGRGRRDLFLWRLARDVGVDAPRITEGGREHRVGLSTQLVWDTMRRLKEFDTIELAAAASTPECTVTQAAVKNLLGPLVSAGYVVKVRDNKPAIRGKPGTATHARYSFVRSKNTGPRPPSLRKQGALYDNNLGKVVWVRPGKAESST
jgi:hypothetical protein